MPSRRRTDYAARRDPIHDAIALRAYEIYLERGATDGHALDDWIEAETQLSAIAASRSAGIMPGEPPLEEARALSRKTRA